MIADVRNYPNGTVRASLRIERGVIYSFFSWLRFVVWLYVIYYLSVSLDFKVAFNLILQSVRLYLNLVFDLLWLWTAPTEPVAADSAGGSWMTLLRFA